MSVDQSEVLVTVETTEVLVPTGNVVIISGIGGGGGGVSDHPSLTGRSTADSHPTSAITGLDAALAARQPLDSDLTAIAALTTTAYGRALLSLVDLPALRSVIGPTGTPSASTFLRGDGQWATPAGGGGGDLLAANNLSDVANAATALANLGGQPSDSDLTAIAALTTTAFGRSFLTLADAAGARTLLVLGTAAQNNTGDFDAAGAAAAAQAASDPVGSAASAVSAHEADTTAVHGIADTSALLDTADIDTDATMAANSDAKVPSQKAVKTALSPGGIAGIYDLIAGGAVRLTDVGSPSYTTTIDGLSVNVQKFQTVGTYLAGWVKPANALFVQVIAIGGGGGGGSGQRVATTAVHAKGGSGGSPGGWDEQTFLASALGSTEDVVVGDGGNGGVAKTADGPGNDGVGGGLSSFGQTSAPWVTGTGGGGGRGGVVWNITDGSRTAGGVVTLTVPTGHTVVAGDRIQVNAADTTYNGSGFAVTSVTATTIVYTQTGGGVDASCGAGQVEVHTRRLGGVGSLTPYLALTTTGDNVAMSPYVTIQNGRLGGVGAGLLQPVPIAGCTDYIGPGGGGGGGGCIGSFALNPASQGGAGKFGGIFGVGNAGGAAGTGVAGPGGVGSSMTTIHADWVGGGGGAGGGAGSFTAAQAGGVGGEGGKYGGGGGGGGNGVGANSGAGGKGGQGVVIVVTYCAAV